LLVLSEPAAVRSRCRIAEHGFVFFGTPWEDPQQYNEEEPCGHRESMMSGGARPSQENLRARA
jgi:hypothetical protein